MSNQIIIDLVEDLSLEFVLADSSEPESLSVLLPILERVGKETQSTKTDTFPKQFQSINKLVKEIIEEKKNGADEKFQILEKMISDVKMLLHNQERSAKPEKSVPENSQDKTAPKPENKPSGENDFQATETSINVYAKLIGGYCPGETEKLEEMNHTLDQLIVRSKSCGSDTMSEVAAACKHYVEYMIQEDINNTKPMEEGLVLLKALFTYLKKGEAFTFEITDILDLLDVSAPEKHKKDDISMDKGVPDDEVPQESEMPEPVTEEKISEEDMEILIDFISEAEENLESIEVHLVELEQAPTDIEIINNIFRPFHTIKGVSGFLALKKINKLAHATENLLDSARSGDFLIDDVATDAVLESVDMLKALIDRVKTGVENGVKEQDGDIYIDTLRDKLQNLQISLAGGEKEPIGEILIRKGVVDQESIDQSLKVQMEKPDKKIGQILMEEEKVTPKEMASALMDQKVSKKKMVAHVKVSTEKLDDLVDYAGELVIAQSMLRQRASGDTTLNQSITQLGQIVTNMQNIAMSMRMIPIKATFMKMIRLVRDLSHKSNKEVVLKMVGEETEIDRNVVDALYEPMVHMIRNSVDHGIESDADRKNSGKPQKGEIVLRSYHKGGYIIIEIEDDGKGLDKDRILEKAISSGLISEKDQLTDAQIYDLILQPGFSTAKEVTDVSGRGVGMDVVKDGIEKFRGNLSISSKKGKGTKFTISLPLTLAIIDGMLVRVGDEKYVIPTTAIQRAFKPEKEECFTVEKKGEMIKERDQLIPVIRLNDMFEKEKHSKPVWESLVVVIESKEEQRGVIIDELLGKDEYVIKSLGANMEGIKGLAGGAILADGRVGLILDVHGVFEIASHSS